MAATGKKCIKENCNRLAVLNSNYCSDHQPTTTIIGKRTFWKRAAMKKHAILKRKVSKKKK